MNLREFAGTFLSTFEQRPHTPQEFVGYVELSQDDVEDTLVERGFSACRPDEWRKLDGDKQIHVGLEERDGDTYIFAHWEYQWEEEPLKYAQGTERDLPKGVNEMRRELNLASISYYNDRTIQ